MTALVHSAVVVEKRDAMKAWTIFLAIVTFALSLLGTFLVRSGVLTSVHAFATDPERGVFILILLLITVGGSLTLFAMRGPALKSTGLFQPISREGGLLVNNLLMSTATAVVLLGTLYPLFLDAIGGPKVSVGAPFFNSVFFPIMTPMVAAMAIGPMLAWKRGDLFGALSRLKAAFAVMVSAAALTWVLFIDGPIIGPLGMGMAAWLGAGALIEVAERTRLFRVSLSECLGRAAGLPRSALGMTLAHLGLAIAIAGMTGAASWKVESIQVMKPGDTVAVGGYDYTFEGARQLQGPNYTSTLATFVVRSEGLEVVTLHPEKRVYPVRSMPTTEAAIHSMFLGDLYAVVGDPEGSQGGYVTRLYFNPLIAWMWAGGLIMVAGGLLSLTDRRFRVGAPTARRRRAQAAEA
ncbi:MAG: cytochrome c-type biogenesis CcmF C-terminal domain-containing protein [Rhodospirillales bacterium]